MLAALLKTSNAAADRWPALIHSPSPRLQNGRLDIWLQDPFPPIQYQLMDLLGISAERKSERILKAAKKVADFDRQFGTHLNIVSKPQVPSENGEKWELYVV